MAERVLAQLVGDHAITLALHHVECGLRDQELRERAHHDRIAQILAYLRDFVEDLVESVLDAGGAKLRAQVRDHPARHLVLVHPRIKRRRFSGGLALAPRDPCEICRHLVEPLSANTRAVPA